MSTTQLVTSNQKLVSTSNKLTSLEIKERALTIAEGLTSLEEPNNMTGWYCSCYKKLGEGKYTAIAKAARSPEIRKPKSVFGYLLSEEMKRYKATHV